MAVRFGPYLLEEKIADGGMAELFLAKKEGAGGWQLPVVVKRILPPFADREDYKKMLFAEAMIATRVAHPNIVHVYDYSEIEGYLCIILEYIAGRDMGRVLEKGGALPWAVVAQVGFEILKALEYLHNRPDPITHRDISPQNVLLSFDGQVKLIDFGIAHAEGLSTAESANVRKGKRAYMPPEYLEQGQYAPQSDVFVVGLVLLQALTGLRPEVVRELGAPSSVERSGVYAPKKLVALIELALQKEAAQRFTSAAQMKSALSALLKEEGDPLQTGEGQIKQVMDDRYPTVEDRTHQPFHKTAVMGEDGEALLETTKVAQVSEVRWVPRRIFLTVAGLALAVLGIGGVLKMRKESVKPALPTQVVDAATLTATATVTPTPLPTAVKGVVAPSKAKKSKVGFGTVSISTHPWATVYLHGRPIGTTPLVDYRLVSGRYELTLIGSNGRRAILDVEIVKGKNVAYFKRLK